MNVKDMREMVKLYIRPLNEDCKDKEGNPIPEKQERLLMRLVKEIERETRHEAVQIIYDCANEIKTNK